LNGGIQEEIKVLSGPAGGKAPNPKISLRKKKKITFKF
jgi:hypothetical protein